MVQLLLNIAPDWAPTLDNFVAGRNVELLSALRHALAGTANERCFYLWGEGGSGKSHLLQAVVEQARALGKPAAYARSTVPDAAQVIWHELNSTSVRPELVEGHEPIHISTSSMRTDSWLIRAGLLVIAVDDVEALDDAAQIALFDLYNRLRESGGMLLVSGTAAPAHLHLRDDLRTRLGWGLVYQVHGLSDEEKAQALERHAQARGFVLPHEVTQYLLRHGRRDLPSLVALLDALDAHCLRLKRGASVPLLKEVMQTFTPE